MSNNSNGWLTWKGCVRLLGVLIVVSLIYALNESVPSFAQEPAPTPVPSPGTEPGNVSAPPGDCWGGTLSRDPLHCYFLEESQRPGKVEVAAIYVAPGGGPLYVFLKQTELITDEVAQFLEAKAHEYVTSEYNAGRTALEIGDCLTASGDDRRHCLNYAIRWPSIEWNDYEARKSPLRPLPPSRAYESILIGVGGPDGRRTVPGWATWSQVWPVSTSGAVGPSDGFDVSDVDLTNIPDPDCEALLSAATPEGRACNARFIFFPDLPIAGWNAPVEEWHPEYGTVYVQIKDLPKNAAKLKALKDKLVPTRKDAGVKIILIPVKYDFAELWRWNVILDRFAVSAANTIGITRADVLYNTTAIGYTDELVWLNGIEPMKTDMASGAHDWSTVRTILIVWSLDPQTTLITLPTVLSSLGIPKDVVGLLAHDDKTPLKVELAIEREDASGMGSDTNSNIASLPQNTLNESRAESPKMNVQSSSRANSEVSDDDDDDGSFAVSGLPDTVPSGKAVSTGIVVAGAFVMGVIVLGIAVAGFVRLRRTTS